MRLNNKIVTRWKMQWRFGDVTKIARRAGVSRELVSRAFAGSASQRIVEEIEKYYKQRNEEERKFQEELLNNK